jgi:hypothetical protein
MKRTLLLLPLLVTAAVSACGGDTNASSPIPFEKNQRQWVLPLDQFGPVDLAASQYAQDLLVSRCMERSGYDWPVAPYRPNEPPTATWNAVGRRLFDVEIAQSYGYRLAPARDQAAVKLAAELNARELAEPEEHARDHCFEELRRHLPAFETDLISSFGGAAYDAALANEGLLAAEKKWRACMRPLGISDLPRMPLEMPSPSVAKRFAVGRNLNAPPAPEEVRLASADARCRESSGFATRLYDLEVDNQLDLIADNEDALERVRAANRGENRKANAVIARYGS